MHFNLKLEIKLALHYAVIYVRETLSAISSFINTDEFQYLVDNIWVRCEIFKSPYF